jgi:hypothetical protein
LGGREIGRLGSMAVGWWGDRVVGLILPPPLSYDHKFVVDAAAAPLVLLQKNCNTHSYIEEVWLFEN